MKTIRGKLILSVSVTAFVILFIASFLSAVSIGKAGTGSALVAGLLIGVVGAGLIDLIVMLTFSKALVPIAELKQFAAGDFSDQHAAVSTTVAEGFKDEIEEVTHATRSIKERIKKTIAGTNSEADSIAKTAS